MRRPDSPDPRGEIPVKKPDGHFQMAQSPGLPAARIEAALYGRADFQVFEMEFDKRTRDLLADAWEVLTRERFGRNESGREQLVTIRAVRLQPIPDDAVRRRREKESGKM